MNVCALVVAALAALLVVALLPVASAAPTPGSVGRRIFFDTDISWSRGQSCASCHDPGSGFADPEIVLPVSEGAILGRFGSRNAPSATSLQERAGEPFLNPLEMNVPNRRVVVARVARSEYADDFRAVFGRRRLSRTDTRRAYGGIVQAFAAYERCAGLNSFTAQHEYAMTLVGLPRMMTFTADEPPTSAWA